MASHRSLLRLAVGVCLAVALVPAAGSQVEFDPDDPPPALDDQWLVLEGAPASALDARDAPAQRAVLVSDDGDARTTWARLQIQSTASRDVRWMLPFTVNEATVYVIGPSGVLDTLRTGYAVPLDDRDTRIAAPPVVQIDLPAGAERTLVAEIRYDPKGYTNRVPIQPTTESVFLADRSRSSVGNGLFLGILIGLTIYNLFLFTSFRDSSYLYYVLFLFGCIVYWGTGTGFIADFVWPSSLRSFEELHFFGLAIAAANYILFARAFLKTPEHSPTLDRVLLMIVSLWAICAIGGLLSVLGAPWWVPVQILAALTTLVMHIATITAGVRAHLAGYAAARFYLLASSTLLCTGFVYTLAWLGWIGPEWKSSFALQVGTAFEVMLFAMALSYRVRVLDRQRSKAIAARKVAEATNAALLETDSLRTDLLGFAAHDLRSPLTGVVGYAELIAFDAPPDSDVAEFAGVIQKEADRMLSLIDDLLVTAALDGRAVELDQEPTDLGEMLHEVVASYRPRAEAKSQTLALEVVPDAIANLDRARFRDVLDNIISNAVKYTPNGGAVSIVLEAGDDLEVRVSDTGPGLTTEDRTKLFGRFQRLSAKPTGGESSTGLGLSIAYDLIVLHGGSIEVESEPGEGATFIVTLPAYVQSALEAEMA